MKRASQVLEHLGRPDHNGPYERREHVMAASQDSRVERTCEACEKRFHLRPEHVRAGMGRFCSRACAGKAHRIPAIARLCEGCSKPIEVPPSIAKQGKGRFCSAPCRYRHFKATPAERFRRYLGEPTETGCILWTGATARGYGVFQLGVGQGTVGAHRFAYEQANGPIPEGMHVLHRCDTPPCCCPSHLFLGTQAENMADMDAKDRRVPAKGERACKAKLTNELVQEIRRRFEQGHLSQRQLGREYGVTHSTISLVVRRIGWKHIE